VLFANLGSPAAPTVPAVRRFLEEFLSDPLVVDLPRLRWWFLRRLVILPLRAPRSARAYRSVWMPEGAPLVVHSRRFAASLGRELGSAFRVAVGMRYGSPSLAEGLRELADAGCEQVLLFPAFPQQSRTTTGTVALAAGRAAKAMARGFGLSVLAPYHVDPGYVSALAERIREARAARAVDHVVLSFHGLPVRLVEAGDPYRAQCEATAAALARALDLAPDRWTLAYQSRFGREPWLEPDVARVVPELARTHRRVLVATPGFACDCLETLEELGLRLRAAFAAAGGEELVLVPCLNDHPAWVRAAAALVRASRGGA
jgi:ferrochelatase